MRSPCWLILFTSAAMAAESPNSRFMKDAAFCFEKPLTQSREIRTFLIPKTAKGCEALISYRLSADKPGDIQIIVDGVDHQPRAYRFQVPKLKDQGPLELKDPDLERVCPTG